MSDSYFNLRNLNLSTDFYITRIKARVLTSDERLEPRMAILTGKYRERFRTAAAAAFEDFDHFIIDELVEERIFFEAEALEALKNGSVELCEVKREITWRKSITGK